MTKTYRQRKNDRSFSTCPAADGRKLRNSWHRLLIVRAVPLSFSLWIRSLFWPNNILAVPLILTVSWIWNAYDIIFIQSVEGLTSRKSRFFWTGLKIRNILFWTHFFPFTNKILLRSCHDNFALNNNLPCNVLNALKNPQIMDSGFYVLS